MQAEFAKTGDARLNQKKAISAALRTSRIFATARAPSPARARIPSSPAALRNSTSMIIFSAAAMEFLTFATAYLPSGPQRGHAHEGNARLLELAEGQM